MVAPAYSYIQLVTDCHFFRNLSASSPLMFIDTGIMHFVATSFFGGKGEFKGLFSPLGCAAMAGERPGDLAVRARRLGSRHFGAVPVGRRVAGCGVRPH